MAKDLENTMIDNNVYLLTGITPETTNQLIMQLTRWVNTLPVIQPKQAKKIYSPYEEIPNNIPVLNVWINSYGGKVNQRQSILTLFNIASAHGAIIKTYNLREASSSASVIAVSGTHGYRYMSESAFHFIHFGQITRELTRQDEAKYIIDDFKQFCAENDKIYSMNTKLTQKELNTYNSAEGSGSLSAEQCLKKGLCDWIITSDGRFVNNIKELKSNQR